MGFMMQPGPTQVDYRVPQAMAQPAMYHDGPEFDGIVDETADLLKKVFGSDNEPVILPASGRGAIEAALTSLYDPDRTVVAINGGVFGNLAVNVCKWMGIPVVEYKYDPTVGVDYAELDNLVATSDASIVLGAHIETSTGAWHDIKRIGEIARKHGAMSMIDAVASLGGVMIAQDELGLDVVIGASQKAVGSLAGISMISLSERARKGLFARKEARRSLYFDLQRWWISFLSEERGGELRFGYRRLPWTMNTHGVFALQRALQIAIDEEGLDERYARHSYFSNRFRAEAEEFGFTSLSPEGARGDTVSALLVPEGFDAKDIVRRVNEEHGISVGAGLEQYAGRLIRIGHMAETARELPVVLTLRALRLVVGK